MKERKWSLDDIPDLSGKKIVVTGGNSGLGFESVKAFAKNGADVILASRSVENGLQAKKMIGEVKGMIEVMQLDLQDFNSIKKFSELCKTHFSKLDVILNNAGIMTTPYFKTKEGLEGQLGTNHFGHFMLTGLLLDLIRKTPGARVVNVSSMGHRFGKMDFNNLMFEKGGYTPMKAYGRTKLANLLFTFELQRFFEKNDMDAMAIAAHPGVSATNLDRYLRNKWWFKFLYPLAKSFAQHPSMGALPQIRACTDPRVAGNDYFGPDGFREMKGYPVRVDSNARSRNEKDAKKLWEISERITGVKYK